MEERNIQNMCKVIATAKLLRKPGGGPNLTAKEIYNYSATGELFEIFHWYPQALGLLGRYDEANAIYDKWDADIAKMKEDRRRMYDGEFVGAE